MPQVDIDITPIQIDGDLYHTIAQFAYITNRSESSVRVLISKGNRVRRLQAQHYGGKPFIPRDELMAFPFTLAGRALCVYHYQEDGSILFDVQEESKDNETT